MPPDSQPLLRRSERQSRYGTLIVGEIIGALLAGGVVLGAAGADPYIALAIVLGALTLHLTARKALRR